MLYYTSPRLRPLLTDSLLTSFSKWLFFSAHRIQNQPQGLEKSEIHQLQLLKCEVNMRVKLTILLLLECMALKPLSGARMN